MLSEKAAALSAILFLSGEPMEANQLKEVLELTDIEFDITAKELAQSFEENGEPYELVRLDTRLQMAVKEEFMPYVHKFSKDKKSQPLSSAALEVLAVIAYNQPVTKSFVEQVRGVNSNNVVNTLLERGLIEEAGRLELPGRPVIYKTTDSFLRGFGLESLGELPKIS